MSLPNNQLSPVAVPAGFIPPDDDLRVAWQVDSEKCGVAIQDPTQGFLVRDWTMIADSSQIFIYPSTDPLDITYLVFGSNITYASFSFDNNMRPMVAFTMNGVSYLRWHDPVPNDVVDLTLPAGSRTPALTLDDKRYGAEDRRDTLLFYIRGNSLYYRQLRDRFTIERELRDLLSADWKIQRVGMNHNLRMQVELWRGPSAGL